VARLGKALQGSAGHGLAWFMDRECLKKENKPNRKTRKAMRETERAIRKTRLADFIKHLKRGKING
jgi:hypothetical protein